jgi:hypothetical protein
LRIRSENLIAAFYAPLWRACEEQYHGHKLGACIPAGDTDEFVDTIEEVS